MLDESRNWARYSWSYQNLIGQDKEWTPIRKPRTVSASENVNPMDDLILVDTASGNVTMTLETAVGCDGRRHSFKKTVAANSMIIDGNGSESIDGAASITRTDQYATVVVESDGSNWVVVASFYSGISYASDVWTPVLTFATPGDLSVTYTSQVATYTKVGGLVVVQYNIVTSAFTHTTASGVATITGLPFTSIATSGSATVGKVRWSGITKANYTEVTSLVGANTATITLRASGSGQTETTVDAADMPTTGAVVLMGTHSYFS